MRQMQNQLFQFLADENGTTAIEYGMIASLLGIAILGSASSVGSTVGNLFNSVATNF
jgi:pilus assembly protein Flp/PilA